MVKKTNKKRVEPDSFIDHLGIKKIVIISKVIFPSQSPRSLRTTELAKGLAKIGHKVTLYAVLGNYDYREFEQQHKICIKNIGETRFLNYNSSGPITRSRLTRNISNYLDYWTEFKNIEFIYSLRKILRKENNTDLLITIGGPHTIHWGVALYKAKNRSNFPKTWIADCGDPFMGNMLFKHPSYFKYIEKFFCKHADYITIPIESAKKAYYKDFHHKIKVIPQGFDFDEIPIEIATPNNQKVTFIYAGVFYKGIRDPSKFLEYLNTVNQDFLFIIFTTTKKFLEPYMRSLGGKLIIMNYIPRSKLLKILSYADFLVNFENGTDIHSPSKLIDYALSGRPILSVNSRYLNKHNIDEFLNGNYKNKLIIDNLDQFDIKNVAANFLSLTR